MKLTFQLGGVREVVRVLRNLEKNAAKKIGRKMVTAGNKVLLRGIKQRTPVDTGTLKKSHGQKVKVYRQSGAVVGIVGPRSSYEKDGRRPSKYAHFVHEKQPFIQQALDEDKAQIQAAMVAAGKQALPGATRG